MLLIFIIVLKISRGALFIPVDPIPLLFYAAFLLLVFASLTYRFPDADVDIASRGSIIRTTFLLFWGSVW